MHVFTHDRQLFWQIAVKLFNPLVGRICITRLHCKTVLIHLNCWHLSAIWRILFLLAKCFFLLFTARTRICHIATYRNESHTFTHSSKINSFLKHFTKIYIKRVGFIAVNEKLRKFDGQWQLPFVLHNILHFVVAYVREKKCPKRTVQFKLCRTSSKSSKMILCLWHFFSYVTETIAKVRAFTLSSIWFDFRVCRKNRFGFKWPAASDKML